MIKNMSATRLTRLAGISLMIMSMCAYADACWESAFGNGYVLFGLPVLAASAVRIMVLAESRITQRLCKSFGIAMLAVIAALFISEIILDIKGRAFEDTSHEFTILIFLCMQGIPILLTSLVFALVPF